MADQLHLYLFQQLRCLAAPNLGDIILVLEQGTEGVVDSFAIERNLVQLRQRVGPWILFSITISGE